VVVCDYDEAWPKLFREIADQSELASSTSWLRSSMSVVPLFLASQPSP
jgi:hypothetical protein